MKDEMLLVMKKEKLKMQNKITMKYPASWHGDMWREGAPCGNGLIGASVYGGILKENIMLNHAYLWGGGVTAPLPDVSDQLPVIRKLLDEKNPAEADGVFTNTLYERGYNGAFPSPVPVCDIAINTLSKDIFSNYRREIDLQRAEVTVSWCEGDISFKRSTFVSRCNNLIFTRFTTDKKGAINTKIAVCAHDTETLGDRSLPNLENFSEGLCSFFAAENTSCYEIANGDYGAVCRVVTDGKTSNENQFIKVENASDILIVTKVFVGDDRKEQFEIIKNALSVSFDYDTEIQKHTELHNSIYGNVNFSISDTHTSNEELLLEAFEKEASNELIEKLYAYGRYLFVCSTSDKDTLPCHLVGLWNGTYNCFWAFYMYNINFEMIYWQALSGNMPSFLRLALDYTESQMEDFKENARKIYGCRGIYIDSVNTPESGLAKCLAHHIINWTGGAAWFSQHYWDYYRFTEDKDYLAKHALPFMAEAALFYEDFLTLDEKGFFVFAPSTSPENTPRNIMDEFGREIETTKNATMEVALLKELLTNLLEGCKITGLYSEKTDQWREMLSHIPPYMINSDGAVKEWTDEYYQDNYNHRHHSHLYPIFPGCEVKKSDEIYKAFEKAEDLRLEFGISDQSSWSVVFMSCIASRMERGDLALKTIDTISRTCLMNNFFTVHNDWRRMGPIACADFRIAPFQIDGNIGIPAAINEMLLQSQFDDLFILPALPTKWREGKIEGILARGNILCTIHWNENGGTVVLKSQNGIKEKVVKLGSGYCFEDKTTEKTLTIENETTIKIIKI